MKKLAMVLAIAFTMGLAASTVNATTKDDNKKTEKKECTATEKKSCCADKKACCSGAAKTETKTENQAPAKK